MHVFISFLGDVVKAYACVEPTIEIYNRHDYMSLSLINAMACFASVVCGHYRKASSFKRKLHRECLFGNAEVIDPNPEKSFGSPSTCA